MAQYKSNDWLIDHSLISSLPIDIDLSEQFHGILARMFTSVQKEEVGTDELKKSFGYRWPPLANITCICEFDHFRVEGAGQLLVE